MLYEVITFSGDTLFNAGAGNCHNGGHPEELYETFSRQLDALGEDTLVYPGHDYLSNNLAFTELGDSHFAQCGSVMPASYNFV